MLREGTVPEQDDRWVLVLGEPSPLKALPIWTGGVRLVGGVYVVQTTDDVAQAWRFPTREKAVETRDDFFETYQPGPGIMLLKPVQLPAAASPSVSVQKGAVAAPAPKLGGWWP